MPPVWWRALYNFLPPVITWWNPQVVGEYWKVSMGVNGSRKGRPPFADVSPLMKSFHEKTMVQGGEKEFIEYSNLLHTQFQYIHPFRDGNGRIGCLTMNILLMKRGYPVLVLPATLSNISITVLRWRIIKILPFSSVLGVSKHMKKLMTSSFSQISKRSLV